MRTQWYYDSFNGLIPVRVLRITGTSGIASTAQRCTLEVTVSRSAYTRGEVIETSGLHLVPWQAVRRTPFGTRIRPYSLEITVDNHGQSPEFVPGRKSTATSNN